MKRVLVENKRVSQIIAKTITVLKKGGLVIFPSDTVYGLLVDATNEEAVKKLIAFKNRPLGKAISVFIADINNIDNYVSVDQKQQSTLHQLLPGPFTMVLPSKHVTSKLLESEKGTLGIRIPDYDLIRQLVKNYGKPITATSANLAGRSSHYSIDSLLKELPKGKQDLVDLIVDAGKLPRNKPSTVLDLTQLEIKVLRKGDIVWKDQKTYKSSSPSQTKKIAAYILEKHKQSIEKNPVVIILKGDLGAGKTLFVKGIAETLGIHNIISPTFVIYYEYPIKNHRIIKNLYHFDLYNIEEKEEFDHLGIMNLLKPGNLIAFEWGEKSAEIFEDLTQKAEVIFVDINYINEKEREITINY